MDDSGGPVFLVDVDNTLLNNDLFQIMLRNHLLQTGGAARRDRYWAIQQDLFHSLGYRDYLGAFQSYRLQYPEDEGALWLASYVLAFDYAAVLFPGALEVVKHLRTLGQVVLLTDGDAVFQPLKVEQSGLAAAVDRHVMIGIHKEEAIAEIERRYPAPHYVVVDDKLRLLTAFKQAWGSRVTTVFPQQGQFAVDAEVLRTNPAADVTVAQIGDLLDPAKLEGIGGRQPAI